MTLAVLEQLTNLVRQGAVIVGNKPVDSPSLADDEVRFHKLADQLFGSRTAVAGTVHKLGKGRVYIGMSANDVLKALDIQRDFDYTKPTADTNLMFVHRRLDNGEVYFVDNRKDRTERVNASFRVEGKIPELWDPATGKAAPIAYKIAEGRTTIPLHLDPNGTTFIVFAKPATATLLDLPEPAESPVSSLDEALNNNWSVSFQPGRGAPESADFDHLSSWSDSSKDGIRYFSGTATYTRTVNIPEGAIGAGSRFWLDLGNVKDVAEVTVNGKYLGILWKTPFKVEVSESLKPGSNTLFIRVTNLWVNRLIGDQQPYAVRKYTFTDFTPYKADSHLLPSGLLGPVKITTAAR
jgi:hypothetical protein